MTIAEAAKKYRSSEIDLLLSFVLNKPKEFLYLHPKLRLTTIQQRKLLLLVKRRSSGEPLAYIVGYKYFYGHKFLVTPSVLIPRPETELLVDTAVALVNKHKLKFVLDVGTGSGAIILSLAKALATQKINLIGSDVSKKVLTVAKLNALKLGLKSKVRFIQSDLLTKLPKDFDLVIANLPYLHKTWATTSIRYEPKQALYATKQGLGLIEKLLQQIAGRKRKPKFILLEFDPRQMTTLQKLIAQVLPQSKAILTRDLRGHYRLAVIRY